MIPEAIYSKPILFPPIFKEKIWGGRKLRTVLSKDIPEQSPIGESWELSGFGSDLSTLPDGETSIQTLLDADPAKLLGDIKNPGYFPLLFKFIDASSMLSVQVHPDDDQAVKNGWGSNGKTECWYIADAGPGGEIIVGFKKGTTLSDVESCIRDNTLERILNRIPIARGDLLFIPAGTVHAILGGTLLYEIQETSDTTFRLYDWRRVDEKGVPRKLHIRESLDVLDMTFHESHKIPPIVLNEAGGVKHSFRAACRYFAVEEYYYGSDARALIPPKSSFAVITVISGACRFSSGGEESTQLATGTTALIPAACAAAPMRVEGARGSGFVLSYVPDCANEIVACLRAQNIDDTRIYLLGGNPGRNDLAPLLNTK